MADVRRLHPGAGGPVAPPAPRARQLDDLRGHEPPGDPGRADRPPGQLHHRGGAAPERRRQIGLGWSWRPGRYPGVPHEERQVRHVPRARGVVRRGGPGRTRGWRAGGGRESHRCVRAGEGGR